MAATKFDNKLESVSNGDGHEGPVARKTFTPCGHLVALHVFPMPKTQAGLLLPEGTSDPFKTTRSQVVSIGPEVTKCKVGDIVLMHVEQRSTYVYHRSVKVYLTHQDHILGVEDPES